MAESGGKTGAPLSLAQSPGWIAPGYGPLEDAVYGAAGRAVQSSSQNPETGSHR